MVQPYFQLLKLLFPNRCRSCRAVLEDSDDALCFTCAAAVEYLGDALCRVCGQPLLRSGGADFRCGYCITTPPPYDVARSVIKYDSPARELLHRLKYQADSTVVPAIKEIIEEFDARDFCQSDMIVPVPLYTKRLKVRGLNQALVLARLFFPTQKARIHPQLLQRIKNTSSQTGLDGAARRRNLRGAFRLKRGESVRGKTVCLVDDVYTTGTTVNECSRLLRRKGATTISVLTLCRVVMR